MGKWGEGGEGVSGGFFKGWKERGGGIFRGWMGRGGLGARKEGW